MLLQRRQRPEPQLLVRAESPALRRPMSLTGPAFRKIQHFSNTCPYTDPLEVITPVFWLDANSYKLNSNLILEILTFKTVTGRFRDHS